MKEHNNVKTMNPSQQREEQKQKKAQIEKEQKMTQAEKMKQRQLEHEQRKKARVDRMHQQEMAGGTGQVDDIFMDPESKKNREIIKQEKIKVEKTIQLIKNDQMSQKNSIESRIAERKKRLEMKRSVILSQNNSFVETKNSQNGQQDLAKQKGEPQAVHVRHSDLTDQRGFVPLISQEELEKDESAAIGSSLDQVEINDNFTSPNTSGINNASSNSPFK